MADRTGEIIRCLDKFIAEEQLATEDGRLMRWSNGRPIVADIALALCARELFRREGIHL